MDKKAILKQTEEYIKNKLACEASGHDWWHVYRVRNNALHIAEHENVDLFVVQLAALLHVRYFHPFYAVPAEYDPYFVCLRS